MIRFLLSAPSYGSTLAHVPVSSLLPSTLYPQADPIESLVTLSEDMSYQVRSFHKPFPDFIRPVARHTVLLIP